MHVCLNILYNRPISFFFFEKYTNKYLYMYVFRCLKYNYQILTKLHGFDQLLIAISKQLDPVIQSPIVSTNPGLTLNKTF